MKLITSQHKQNYLIHVSDIFHIAYLIDTLLNLAVIIIDTRSNILRHLKLEIALEIPASNDEKY